MKGQIRKALSGFYYIYAQGDTYQTRARGNFRNRNITPLVGDEVIFESDNPTDGYLLEILPRRNELLRPPVANVDLGVIVMSAVEPDFSYNLLDRFLVNLEFHGIMPLIYFTKSDLLSGKEWQQMRLVQKQYQQIGYEVILPKREDHGVAVRQLEQYFPERLVVFMGQSGVGKSTLLNQISPELHLETGEISEALGRGKHTTRHVELIPLYDGLVADTPGFSSLEFLGIEAIDLPKLFPEFVEAAPLCKFRECMHDKEPDCEVKRRVASGAIAESRYNDYQQFLADIEKRRPIYRKKK